MSGQTPYNASYYQNQNCIQFGTNGNTNIDQNKAPEQGIQFQTPQSTSTGVWSNYGHWTQAADNTWDYNSYPSFNYTNTNSTVPGIYSAINSGNYELIPTTNMPNTVSSGIPENTGQLVDNCKCCCTCKNHQSAKTEDDKNYEEKVTNFLVKIANKKNSNVTNVRVKQGKVENRKRSAAEGPSIEPEAKRKKRKTKIKQSEKKDKPKVKKDVEICSAKKDKKKRSKEIIKKDEDLLKKQKDLYARHKEICNKINKILDRTKANSDWFKRNAENKPVINPENYVKTVSHSPIKFPDNKEENKRKHKLKSIVNIPSRHDVQYENDLNKNHKQKYYIVKEAQQYYKPESQLNFTETEPNNKYAKYNIHGNTVIMINGKDSVGEDTSEFVREHVVPLKNMTTKYRSEFTSKMNKTAEQPPNPSPKTKNDDAKESDSSTDLRFLEDINIDEIVECLKTCDSPVSKDPAKASVGKKNENYEYDEFAEIYKTVHKSSCNDGNLSPERRSILNLLEGDQTTTPVTRDDSMLSSYYEDLSTDSSIGLSTHDHYSYKPKTDLNQEEDLDERTRNLLKSIFMNHPNTPTTNTIIPRLPINKLLEEISDSDDSDVIYIGLIDKDTEKKNTNVLQEGKYKANEMDAELEDINVTITGSTKKQPIIDIAAKNANELSENKYILGAIHIANKIFGVDDNQPATDVNMNEVNEVNKETVPNDYTQIETRPSTKTEINVSKGLESTLDNYSLNKCAALCATIFKPEKVSLEQYKEEKRSDSKIQTDTPIIESAQDHQKCVSNTFIKTDNPKAISNIQAVTTSKEKIKNEEKVNKESNTQKKPIPVSKQQKPKQLMIDPKKRRNAKRTESLTRDLEQKNVQDSPNKVPPKKQTYQTKLAKEQTRQKIPPQVKNQKIPSKVQTDKKIPPKKQTIQKIPPINQTDDKITAKEETYQKIEQTEDKIPLKEQEAQNIPPKEQTDEKTPLKDPIEEKIPPKVPTDDKILPEELTDDKIPPKEQTDKKISLKEQSIVASSIKSEAAKEINELNIEQEPILKKEIIEEEINTIEDDTTTNKEENNENLPQAEESSNIPADEQKTIPSIAKIEESISKYFQSRCEITGIIKEGAFSNIYRCKIPGLLAAKLIREKEASQSFGKNMNAAQSTSFLSNTVFYMTSLKIDDHWCYLMEHYPHNLAEYMAIAQRCFPIYVIRILAKQLVSALTLLRNNKFIHSDICPKHILINDNGSQLKLCGFDDMYKLGTRQPDPNMGTLNYRAPELILGNRPMYGVDVWSAMAVLYEMATFKKLFRGTTNNEVLFKQMILSGGVPDIMLQHSFRKDVHFTADHHFIRHAKGHKIVQIRPTPRSIAERRLLTQLNQAHRKYSFPISTSNRMFAMFLLDILQVNPCNRPKIVNVQKHPFLGYCNHSTD